MRLLTESEAARLAGVKTPAVRHWIKSGAVRAKVIPYGETRLRHLIPLEDVEAQVERMAKFGKAPGGRRRKERVVSSCGAASPAIPPALQAFIEGPARPFAKAMAVLCHFQKGEGLATAAALTAATDARVDAKIEGSLHNDQARLALELAALRATEMALRDFQAAVES